MPTQINSIRALRDQLDVTQDAVARATGVSLMSVQNAERRPHLVAEKLRTRICRGIMKLMQEAPE